MFISYRRDDSAGWAGRLGDDLADRLGTRHVFRDVEIPAGVDYERHIEHVLDSCQVVIVVIGPQWASARGSDGTLRLEQPGDVLRREIERALERADVAVVPVLVERAVMPAADDLPEGLRALARRQAVELSDARWRQDVTGLAAALRGAAEPGAERPGAEPAPRRDRLTAMLLMVGAAGLGASIGCAILKAYQDTQTGVGSGLGDVVNGAGMFAILWGIIGPLVFAAAAATLPGVRANALRWSIAGLFTGVAAGLLSGATYGALTPDGASPDPFVSGVATATAGAVIGLGLAKRTSSERSIVLAGAAGGLLGGLIVQIDREDFRLIVLQAMVTIGALAWVACGGPGVSDLWRRARART